MMSAKRNHRKRIAVVKYIGLVLLRSLSFACVCVCVRLFSAASLYSFFPSSLGKIRQNLSLSLLHRHRVLAPFTPRVKPTMEAAAVLAAQPPRKHIFFTSALLPRRKGHRVRNSVVRVNNSAGKNDVNEEEEESTSSNALASLERELSLQISLENYTEAAKLRDSIALLKRDDLVAVETCNSLFYDAFRRGDFTLMHSKVWGSGAHVRCTHPGMPTVLGDENVKESWRIVFESMGGAGGSESASSSTSQQKMDVKCKSVQAYANGNLGIVTCEEVVMRASTLTCTNVFEKQGGEWRMIQHHASAVFPGSVAAGGSSASSSS